jgi:hypothetical protein
MIFYIITVLDLKKPRYARFNISSYPFSIHSQYEKSKQPEIIHIEENNFGSHAHWTSIYPT